MVTLTNSPTYGPLPTFAPPARGLRLAGIAAAHALVAWALLHSDVVGIALRQATPLTVALISQAPTAPKAEPSLPQALPRSAPPRVPALPPPEITVAPAAPTNMPAVAPAMMAPAAVVRAEPADVNPVAAAPTQRAPTTPVVPTPASPKPLTAGAIHYRVPPPVVVPMASRRLGESGTVLLRVHVDALGLPRQITLHRSSGFARLDEQAMAAMRAARFEPVTEGGAAIEWLVIAPLQYEID